MIERWGDLVIVSKASVARCAQSLVLRSATSCRLQRTTDDGQLTSSTTMAQSPNHSIAQ